MPQDTSHLTALEEALLRSAAANGITSVAELLAAYRAGGPLADLTACLLRAGGFVGKEKVERPRARRIPFETRLLWLMVMSRRQSSEAKAIEHFAEHFSTVNDSDYEKELMRIKQAVQRGKRYFGKQLPKDTSAISALLGATVMTGGEFFSRRPVQRR